jgi:hemerythrin
MLALAATIPHAPSIVMTEPEHEPAWQLGWHDGLAVGDAQIDRAHKELIERVNGLNAALVAQSGRDDVLRQMEELLAFAAAHFAREEALLEHHGYPELERHRQAHARLLAGFRDALDNFSASNVSLTRLAKGLLISHSMMEHLAKDDMLFRDFLRAGDA